MQLKITNRIAGKIDQLHGRLNRMGRDMSWFVRPNHSFFRKVRGARILVYHGVCENDPFRFNTLFITTRRLEEHLEFYKKHFNILSLDDFYEQRFDPGRFNTCLTFDDGFANNYKHVLPLLEQYEIPATFFITAIRNAGYDILWNDALSIASKTGPKTLSFDNEEFRKIKQVYLSQASGTRLADRARDCGFDKKARLVELLSGYSKKVAEDYWLQMTQQQIKQLASSKWVTIGSHGYYHNDLGKIPVEELKKELLHSRRYLENIIGKEVKAFAFPYGSYTHAAVEEAKKAGYAQLLATDFIFPEDKKDPVLRERFTINPFISSINQMHANVRGHYR